VDKFEKAMMLLSGELPDDVTSSNFSEYFSNPVVHLPQSRGGAFIESNTIMCHDGALEELWDSIRNILSVALWKFDRTGEDSDVSHEQIRAVLDNPEFRNSGKVYNEKWNISFDITDILAFDKFCRMRAEILDSKGYEFKKEHDKYWYEGAYEKASSTYKHFKDVSLDELPLGLNSPSDFVVNYLNVAKIFSYTGKDEIGIVTSDIQPEKRFSKLLANDSKLKIVRTPAFIYNPHNETFQSREPLVSMHSVFER